MSSYTDFVVITGVGCTGLAALIKLVPPQMTSQIWLSFDAITYADIPIDIDALNVLSSNNEGFFVFFHMM